MVSGRKPRAYHKPKGSPCAKCGLPLDRHYPSHNPRGYPDCECGAPWENHKSKTEQYFAGIDGEGVGRKDHKYTLLAWSDESGKQAGHIQAQPGLALSTVECLDFILATPRRAQFFSFAFNYDLTKILTDVDDAVLYMLFRPELRPNNGPNKYAGPRYVKWKGYRFNLVGSKFTLQKGKRRVVIWDVFKFFQCKFVKALIDWKVEDADKLTRMQDMKDKRSDFDKQTPEEIREYCYEECRYMAALASKLVNAHTQAGLTLRNYFGAGSTAAAMLKIMGIDKEVRTGPEAMTHAIECGFFGGRFENSVIGEIPGPVYDLDISSAYPYQIYQLPCLGCGKWELTRNRNAIEGAQSALIHYTLGMPDRHMTWGPFPFRMDNGSIAFPATSGGGWVWKDEFIQGEKLFSHVHFIEAWVYRTECTHRPFEQIPQWYVERLRIGKQGPGIVLKLGLNANYGKMAQSVGDKPPFQSWIWAGMVTSGTRAQILELAGLHNDLRNMLVIATDGVKTLENITPPKPIDTGTDIEYMKDGKLTRTPLGGWEKNVIETGLFAARPGIYFPLGLPPKEMEKAVRARGVGRGSMVKSWQKTVDAWNAHKSKVKIADVTRFHGAKSSISLSWNEGKPVFKRSEEFGQWTKKGIDMTFNPLPKREKILPGNVLQIRSFSKDDISLPYKRTVLSPEAVMLKIALAEILEQADGDDYADYESE